MAETSFTGRINGIVFENNQDLFKIIDVLIPPNAKLLDIT